MQHHRTPRRQRGPYRRTPITALLRQLELELEEINLPPQPNIRTAAAHAADVAIAGTLR